MRVNPFGNGEISMKKVRAATAKKPELKATFQECRRLYADCLLSSHVTVAECSLVYKGIKKLFNVKHVDVSEYLPQHQEQFVIQNGANRWQEQQRELRSALSQGAW